MGNCATCFSSPCILGKSCRSPRLLPFVPTPNPDIYPVGTDPYGRSLGTLPSLTKPQLLENLGRLDQIIASHGDHYTLIVLGDALDSLFLQGQCSPEYSHPEGIAVDRRLPREISFFGSTLSDDDLKRIASDSELIHRPLCRPGWINNRIALTLDSTVHENATRASVKQNLLLFSSGHLKILAADWIFAFCFTADKLSRGQDRLTQEVMGAEEYLSREMIDLGSCLRRWVEDRNGGHPLSRRLIRAWASYFHCEIDDDLLKYLSTDYEYRFSAKGIKTYQENCRTLLVGAPPNSYRQLPTPDMKVGTAFMKDRNKVTLSYGQPPIFLADGRIIKPTRGDAPSDSEFSTSSISTAELPAYMSRFGFKDARTPAEGRRQDVGLERPAPEPIEELVEDFETVARQAGRRANKSMDLGSEDLVPNAGPSVSVPGGQVQKEPKARSAEDSDNFPPRLRLKLPRCKGDGEAADSCENVLQPLPLIPAPVTRVKAMKHGKQALLLELGQKQDSPKLEVPKVEGNDPHQPPRRVHSGNARSSTATAIKDAEVPTLKSISDQKLGPIRPPDDRVEPNEEVAAVAPLKVCSQPVETSQLRLRRLEKAEPSKTSPTSRRASHPVTTYSPVGQYPLWAGDRDPRKFSVWTRGSFDARGSSPRGSSPKGGSPRRCSPKGTSPRGSSPRGSSPRGTNSGRPNNRGLNRRGQPQRGRNAGRACPRGSSPKGSSPRGSSPAGSSPRGSSPPGQKAMASRGRKAQGIQGVRQLKEAHEKKIREEFALAERDGY